MSKIQKTIARQQDKIAEGQFYEAHQQLRVVASRYVKQSNWSSALDILYEGSLSLLKASQGGSGGDLALYFIDALDKAERQPNSNEKGRVLALLRAFPEGEPTRKRFIGDAVAWTAKKGDCPNGDPELHHVAGSLYADEYEPYEAEKHLALGTKDSPEKLARLEHIWYMQDELHTAPLYAARTVFPYLLNNNLRSANKAYLLFTSSLSSSGRQSLVVKEVVSSKVDIRIYPALPLLNFIGLLLLAVQRCDADLFRILAKQYAKHLEEVGGWDDALKQIGELYFGIHVPKQGNPLFDMMGSMLFGGGGGTGGSSGALSGGTSVKDRAKRSGAPPTGDLD